MLFPLFSIWRIVSNGLLKGLAVVAKLSYRLESAMMAIRL